MKQPYRFHHIISYYRCFAQLFAQNTDLIKYSALFSWWSPSSEKDRKDLFQ